MQRILAIFWNAAEHRIRCLWRMILNFVGLIVMVIVSAVVATLLVLAVGVDDFQDSPLFMSLQAIVQNAMVIGLVVLGCFWPDRRMVGSLGLRFTKRWWIDCGGGFALGAVLMTMVFLFQLTMGWITVQIAAFDPNEMITGQTRWLIAMLFVGAGEEILSRGYHLKNLCEGFRFLGVKSSVVIASILSSGFFALFHVFNPASTWVSSLSICMAGLMFCIGRLTTGSLAAPIGMHFSWNYFQGGVFGFPVSGNQMSGSLMETKQYGIAFYTGGEFGPEAGLLGVFAITTGIIAFLFWPQRESKLMASVVDMAKWRRRRSRTNQAPPIGLP